MKRRELWRWLRDALTLESSGRSGCVARRCALAVCAAMTFAMPAFADGGGRTSSLSFTRLPGSETCIGARELAEAVEARLGRPVFVSTARADLVVEGRIERAEETRWKATFSVTRADGTIVGTRELDVQADSCRKLDQTLAVLVALLIDPEARAEPPPPEPEPEPRPTNVNPPAPSAPPPAEPGLHVEVAVGGAALTGSLPEIAPALRAATALRFSGWSLELAGALTDSTEASDGRRGAELRSGHVELAACPTLANPASLRVDACGGVQWMRLWGRGRDLEANEDVRADYVALSALARLHHGFTEHFGARLAVGGWFPTTRPELRYTELDTTTLRLEPRKVFRVAPIGALAHLSLVADFF